MARRSGEIVALDIGASSIKAGIFSEQRKSGLELLRFGVRDLGDDPSQDNESQRMANISEAVTELMAELAIQPGSPALISVPGQSVFSRFVKLPPVDREKILQIVRYEAQQNVPFPIDEVVWDYQLVGADSGEVDVMLAAIKKEMIESITGAVSAAGLQPELVDVSPMALYNVVRYNYAELPACTLVMDIGARSTDLIFIEANRVFNRSIPVGGNAITQQIMKEFDLPWETAEDLKQEHAFVAFSGAYEAPASETADKVSKTVRSVMTRLHAEINRSIHFYRTQQSGSQPGLVLLTGGSAVIAHMDTFLKEKLRTEVDHLNPFNNIAVGPEIEADRIGSFAHLLGEVAGLALRRSLACPIELNLLPPHYVSERTFHRRQPFLIASALVLALVGVVWWAYFFTRAAQAKGRLDELTEKLTQLQNVERSMRSVEMDIDRLKTQGSRIAALTTKRGTWASLLDDLHKRVPEGMWLYKIGIAPPPAKTSPSDQPYPGQPSPAGETPAGPAPISALEIKGYAYLDKIPEATAGGNEDGIIAFRNKLRASPFLTEETDVEIPVPAQDDFLREFTLKAVLKEPIPL
ncbi:MAG: type IV pilus assembly protein PilM [Kiritimatiellae bacterium]|nr:type IV pilus assembly protein PilM [Kiritimatiellia bacterium]